jgi:hypothetical protein
MEQPQPERGQVYADPPPYFNEALEDAERLLKYASEIGLSIEDSVRNHILEARSASGAKRDEETVANLLAALAKLAAQLKPVTAQSLKESGDTPLAPYYWRAISLAVFLILVSALSFVTSAVSNTIKTDISAANDLAVTLRGQLGPAPPKVRDDVTFSTDKIIDAAVIPELQQFASDIREIDTQTRLLRALVFGPGKDPFSDIRNDPKQVHNKFQFNPGVTDLAGAASERTFVYQDVRYYGQTLVDDVAVFYGAITTCILPALYALLGACAYLLRTFEQQISARTYTKSAADLPRFLIAGIGGAVVGLFNNFVIGQGVSIPPLAIAFLVGYAVDVFFTSLEALSQKFTKSTTASSAPQPANGGKT